MDTNNTISRYIAILDRDDGPLVRLIPRLQELGFRCLQLPEAADCEELLKRYAKLCWLAVNSVEVGDQASSLLALAETHHPRLPLLWLDPTGESQILTPSVTTVTTPPSAEHLASLVEEALNEKFYDTYLVEALDRNAERSLASLGAFAALKERFMTASTLPLSEVNSVITFWGEGLSGYAVVSCGETAARYTTAQAFEFHRDEVAQAHVADMLGEVVNRIVGGMMPYFEANGVSVQFGLPEYCGANTPLRWDNLGTPALGLEFEGAYGPVFVEFALAEFSRGREPQRALPPRDLLEPGACLFL